MDSISYNAKGGDQLVSLWRQSPQIVQEELLAAMTEADALLEREVKEATPSGASGGGAAGLKGSIFSEARISADGAIGVVASPLLYAEPVELGTAPHFPPVEALEDWVRVKLGVREEREVRQAAFLIARKISRVGTKGVHMFGATFARLESQIDEIFGRARDRVAARLGLA